MASQTVGLATGIQDKFSFKGVALAALSGAVGGGLAKGGDIFKNGAFSGVSKSAALQAGLQGATASAITQGIATAAGLQSKFSFAGVAAAGVGAAAGSALGGSFGAPASKLAAFGQNLATTTASGIANAATRSAINGNSFGDNLTAAIPDIIGQAVGGALGRAVYDPERAARRQVEEPLAAGTRASEGQIVTSSILAQSLGGYIPTASDTLLAGIGAPLELAPALRIQLLENSGAIGSEQAADLRARSARLRHEIVTDLATRASADGSGSETYRDIDLRDGERGIALNAAGYAATHAELNLRYVQLGAERKAGNIDDNVWATLQQARVDNAAMINEWNAIADREVINLISSVYGGVDVAKGTYRIAVNGEHTTDNYISAGAGLAGAALGGVVKVGAKGLSPVVDSLRSGRISQLLPGEGLVGSYRELIAAGTKGDNITPHHIPSADRMLAEGVSKGDGIAINMEHPFPGTGGRHRATFTFGNRADADLSPRAALAAGVFDARRIYQADGLYTPQIRSSLQELIRLNKSNHQTIFAR